MKFYKKELLSNRLALPNGRGVQFEPLGDSDTGVLATENPDLIAELDKAVAARRGGIVAIDDKTYEELKKNPPAVQSRIRSLNAQSVRQILTQRPDANGRVAAPKHEPSAPLEVPKGIVTLSSIKKLKTLKGIGDPTPAAVAAAV